MKSFRRNTALKNTLAFVPFFRGRGLIFLFLGLGVLLIALSSLRPTLAENIRVLILDQLSPVIQVFAVPIQTITMTTRDMTGLSQLKAENKQLRVDNDKLQKWYQTALFLEAENQALKDLLNVKTAPDYTVISSRVLSDTGNRFARTLLLPIGYDDSIKKGQAVMAAKGMIGRIIETGKTTSRVLLLTDINARVPVLLSGTNQHSILSGNNTDHPELLYLDEDSTVTLGTQVVTSGQGGVFPAGLPIGEIVKTGDDGYGVKLFSDPKRLVFVSVLDYPGNIHFRQIVSSPNP